MPLIFIDRTPPIYEGDQDKHNAEMANYLAYVRETLNYNLNQLGATPSGEEANNGE